LPVPLRALEQHEVEDVLCIYKSVLGPAFRGDAIDLPDDARCYLDEPDDSE
jgi:hypothetical protein